MFQCIGVMTGNSMDAVDVIYTRFDGDKMEDICAASQPVPAELSDRFRSLKQRLAQNGGNIEQIAQDPEFNFSALHDDYVKIVAETINTMISQNRINPHDVDLIGFHGQTCAHCPPSIARSKNPRDIYILQIGSGQMLADLTGIPVAYDFRSDDLMNLGEAAPLAPVHNKHIAADLKTKGIFPVAFCNGGNTGNISVVSENRQSHREELFGWDAGPFNHFSDHLCRTELNTAYDAYGCFGARGQINNNLLRRLFDTAVITKNGENFLYRRPPRSSDPAWYRIIPELTDPSLQIFDRLRTVQYFSAYIFAYSLRFLPENILKPRYFLLFGGGWKNPLVTSDFRSLLTGRAPILPEHQEIFSKIQFPEAVVEWSDKFKYNSQYMEARIFADMAKCCLTREPFSYPGTTGCQTPTVGGIIARPGGSDNRRWSRAAKGWADKAC